MRSSSTTRATLRIFAANWLKRPRLLAGSLLLAPAFVLQNTIFPLCIAKILNQLAAHRPVSSSYLWWAGITMLAGILLNYVSAHRYEVPLNILGVRDIYNRCLEHLMRQEYAFFADNFGGSLVARAGRMAKGYEAFTYTTFVDMLGLLAGVVVSLGIMVFYSPLIGITTAAVWGMSIACVVILTLRRMPLRRAAVAKETQQTGELSDIVANAITVKTFAREATEEQRYRTTNQQRADLFRQSWRKATHNGFAIQLFCGLLQLMVLAGGVWGVHRGTLSIGTFLLFQVYILRVIDSVVKASSVVRQFEGVLGDAHEMTELLQREPAIQDPAEPQASRIAQGTVAFQTVDFNYTGGGKKAPALLQNFTLTMQAGEKVGLVGPSGGGKTTLTKLLLRFADVQGGAITIDGQDIRAIRQDDLHRAISYVPQEPLMFHRSIRENIRYGNPEATDADIIRVAKQAHAHDFIQSLPAGYDTLVGERGIKLSGGQRQRIAIARAMVKQAPILVLDEATSALDSESEVFIQQGLWKLMQHKTTVVIAHRLSTIQKMDRIIVLDKGRIVEQGTHAALLRQKGLYATLWAHQSGGFIEE